MITVTSALKTTVVFTSTGFNPDLYTGPPPATVDLDCDDAICMDFLAETLGTSLAQLALGTGTAIYQIGSGTATGASADPNGNAAHLAEVGIVHLRIAYEDPNSAPAGSVDIEMIDIGDVDITDSGPVTFTDPREWVVQSAVNKIAITSSSAFSIQYANPSTKNVTGVASTDVITVASAHGLVVGDPVVFASLSGGSGLSDGTIYYVESVPSTTTLTVSATSGGAALNFTTDIASGTIRRAWANLRVSLLIGGITG